MAIAFPASPGLNQIYSYGGRQWIWNGYAWQVYPTSFTNGITIGATTISNGTANRILYDNGGFISESAGLQYDGATLTTSNDANIHGVGVGRGASGLSNNTSVGQYNMTSITTGDYNTAIGVAALQNTQNGDHNVAVGAAAMAANTSGQFNVAAGPVALASNTSGNSNSAFGPYSAYSNLTGNFNVVMGSQALYTNSTGSNNVALGSLSLFNSTSSNNVGVGYAALTTLTSGTNNTAVGYSALSSCTGSNNVAIGYNSGQLVSSGSNNAILGSYDGNTAPISNSGSGYVVLSDGAGNVRQVINSSGFVGFGSASSPTSNLAVSGNDANIVSTAINNTSQSNQVLTLAMCGSTGYGITGWDNSGVIEALANSVGSGTRGLYLSAYNGPIMFATAGRNIQGSFDLNGYLLLGYASSNGAYRLQVNSQIFATNSTIATSDARYKENVVPLSGSLDIINALNPVSFDWKEHPVHDFDRSSKTVGFIAQEVEDVIKDLPFAGSIIKNNECELPDGTKEAFLGIAEGNILAILVSAVKELSAQVEELKAKVQ